MSTPDWFTDADAAHDPEALSVALQQFASTDWANPAQLSEAGLRRAFDGVQAYAWAGEAEAMLEALGVAEGLVMAALAAEPSALWPLQGLVHVHQLVARYDTHDPARLPALERLAELDAHAAGRGPEGQTLADAALISAYAARENWVTLGAEPQAAAAAAAAIDARFAALVAELQAATPPNPRAALLLRTLLLQLPGLDSGEVRLTRHRQLVELTAHDAVEHTHALFDLGVACYEEKRYAEAEAAWQLAQTGYAALGPDYEMHLHQTESWLEAAAEAADQA